MPIDVTKETLCINKIVGQKNETIIVEGDVIVPDVKPDILNAINTTGNVCIYKKDILEGKIRLDGDVKLYVMYLADDEKDSIRSLNTNIDFTKVIDIEGCMQNMSLDDEVTIKSIECQVLNGRKINIKVTLQIGIKIYSNEDVDVIKQIDNLKDVQSLNSTLKINSLVGEGTVKSSAKDTVVIDNVDNLAEVLSTDIYVTNKDIKISYNKVLAKADIVAKILYLTEEGAIKVKEATIPLMGFVDIENIKDTDICDMKYKLKNIIIKPNSQEEHSIYVELEFELYCRVYEEKEIETLTDLYSPSMEISYEQKNITTMANRFNASEKCSISEKISIPELNSNKLYDVKVKPVIVSQNISNSRIMYEGELQIDFIYSSNNSAGIDTKQAVVPFNFNVVSDNISQNANIETEVEIVKQDFIIGNDSIVDSKIELNFNVSMANYIDINIINDIHAEELKKKEIYSMIIYFVKEGDTLWKIAKKYKSTKEDIARVNNIEDVNKIYVGQQLFIPKYTEKSSVSV